MKKAEVIARVMKEARNSDDGQTAWTGPGNSFVQYVSDDLERRLKDLAPDVDVLICKDFRHLGVECCSVCHNEYPDEQALVELESGRIAWLCCSTERALDRSEDAAAEQNPA